MVSYHQEKYSIRAVRSRFPDRVNLLRESDCGQLRCTSVSEEEFKAATRTNGDPAESLDDLFPDLHMNTRKDIFLQLSSVAVVLLLIAGLAATL